MYGIVIDILTFFIVLLVPIKGEVMSPVYFSFFIEDFELFLQDDVNLGLDINDI